MGDRESGGDERDSRGSRDRAKKGKSSNGFSFRLPTLKLPNVAFPKNLRITLPASHRERGIELRATRVLAVAILVDLLYLALLLLGGSLLLDGFRVVAGTVVALVLVGLPGIVYVWEGLAVLLGFTSLTAFPSATALTLTWLFR